MHKRNVDRLKNAAQSGDLETVKSLVEAGIDVNDYGTSGKRMTAMHQAAKNGKLSICKYLRKNGAQLHLKDNDGNTPLIWASFSRHISVMKWLIQEGSDINESDNIGYTGLHEASQNGDITVVQCLIQMKANVNAKSKDGYTPLYCAVKDGHLDVVKYLCEKGANINATNNEGSTPLILACNNGHEVIVKWLIKQKFCNIHHTNEAGFTCLHAACDRGHLKIVKRLVNNGSMIDQESKNGSTPFMRAKAGNHDSIVNYLTSNKTTCLNLENNKKKSGEGKMLPTISETSVCKTDKKYKLDYSKSDSSSSEFDNTSGDGKKSRGNRPSVDTASSTSLITDLSESLSSVELNDPIQGNATFGKAIKPTMMDQIIENYWQNEQEDKSTSKNVNVQIEPSNSLPQGTFNKANKPISREECGTSKTESDEEGNVFHEAMLNQSCNNCDKCAQNMQKYLDEIEKQRREIAALKMENEKLKAEKADKTMHETKSEDQDMKTRLKKYISENAIDECLIKASSPTHLTTLLIGKMYTDEYLAQHCVEGRGKNDRPGLDTNKTDSAIDFVMKKYPNVERTRLVTAINQRCSDIRKVRKRKQKNATTGVRNNKTQKLTNQDGKDEMEIDSE